MNIFETAKGTKFAFQFIPKEALKAQKEAAQDPLSESFATSMLGLVNGSEIDMKNTLADFPIQLTFVIDYAKT